MQSDSFTFEDLKKHLKPWQVAVLVGAGITVSQFFSLVEMWSFALAFGGQVLSTAFLFIIIDVVIDVISNANQLRKDRKFRLNWAKGTYKRLFAQTKKTFLFATAISLASLFVPTIVTVLMTATACGVFTMGIQCVESVLRDKGFTPENNKLLQAFQDASYAMLPVLSYLQATVNRVKNSFMTGLAKAFNWTRNAVMLVSGKVFESAQTFITFLMKEGSKRFFRKAPAAAGPFEMTTSPA